MEDVLKTMISRDEKILWEGKNDFQSTLIRSIVASVILIGIAYFFKFIITLDSGTCTVGGASRDISECIYVFSYFFYGMIILAVIMPPISLYRSRKSKYMLTNKRILIKSGVTGGNIDSIFYEKVENTHLRINLIGKITGTGSLFIDTGEKVFMKRGARSVYHKIDSILKPYEIYKILQEQVNKKIKRTSKKGSIEE